MKTFNNDPTIKEKLLKQLQQRNGAPGGTCWIDGEYRRWDPHYEMTIPMWLSYLWRDISDNLTGELAFTWPSRFIDAMPVGVDIDKTTLWNELCIWVLQIVPILKDDMPRVCNTLSLHLQVLSGNYPTQDEWEDAARQRQVGADAVGRVVSVAASNVPSWQLIWELVRVKTLANSIIGGDSGQAWKEARDLSTAASAAAASAALLQTGAVDRAVETAKAAYMAVIKARNVTIAPPVENAWEDVADKLIRLVGNIPIDDNDDKS